MSTQDAGVIQVSTTLQSRDDAQSIAQALVERRLAACVQVAGPIASTYRWQDKVEHAEEWLCLIKTCAGCLEEIERAISRLHPYEVPEIVVTPIQGGSAAYLSWIADQIDLAGAAVSESANT